MTNFSLIPFPDNLSHPNIEIKGQIERLNHQLTIAFHLSGKIEQVAIAYPEDSPARRNELWQTTCFEFFLGLKGNSRYWEFNLSPAGHWNIYRFDDYRQGMIEESAFQTLPFLVKIQPNNLTLSLTLDLEPIIPWHQALEIGITTVIQSKLKDIHPITYWALAHVIKEADFHQRQGFVIDYL